MRTVRQYLDDHAEQVAAALELPHAIQDFIRPVLRESPVVARFALPLQLCPTRNAGRREQPWQRKRLRDEVLASMRMQWTGQREAAPPLPLAGRPQVIAIRFSTSPPDVDGGFAKQAIDCLTPAARGLGIIRDDGLRAVDRVEFWEQGARGRGFVWIEVRV